jgi:hypothetical protein
VLHFLSGRGALPLKPPRRVFTKLKNDLTTQYLFPYTSEQVLGLAQHDYQVKTSRELAFVHKWQALGHNEKGIWGEIPVKDKTPIQTKVLLSPLSFCCSCVSYHSPCQHALGLLLLWLEHPEAFTLTNSPAWLTWAETDELDADNEFAENSQRRTRIETGLAELELWLHDLVRSGLEAARTRLPTYYQQMADRLIDATLSEVAKDIRQLASINVKHPRWHEDYLSVLGRLHLLIQGFKRLDDLPEITAADLRMAVGWLPNLQAETFADTWHVVGRRVEAETHRKVQRTYLWSEESSRPAVLVDVLHGTKTANTRFLPGVVLEATLEFYTSSTPLRAELHSLQKITQPEKAMKAETSIKLAIANFTTVKTANPWLRTFPLILQEVVAEQHEGNWVIRDSEGYFLPLPPRFAYGWYLRALSASGLWLFGEYDGVRFLPISTWANDRLLELHTLKALP